MATAPTTSRHPTLLLAAAGLLAAACMVLWLNLDLPLVRNGITYARTSEAIVDAGFDALAVGADSSLLFGRPIGFPLASSPFVRWFGANRGLKIASFLSTLLFAGVSCLFLVRMRRLVALDPRLDWIDVVLLCFNPLVVYQVWSAHPDALFSAVFLLSLLLADRLATAAGLRRALLATALGLAIYASIEFKYYGAILIAIVPAYFALRTKGPASRLLPVVAAVSLPLLLVVAGFAGANPTLNLGVVSGMDRYEDALSDSGTFMLYAAASVAQIAVFLVIVFGSTIPYLFHRPPRSRTTLALGVVVALFALGPLPFRGTGYNMRYFLPLLPILVLAVREGLRAASPGARRVALTLFLVLQSVMILDFNSRPVYETFAPLNRALESIRYPGTRRVMSVFDSLRMGHHVASQQLVEFIEGGMRTGETLYVVTDYYGTAAHRFGEDMGLVTRSDVEIRYVASLADLETEQPDGPYYVCVRCDEILVAPDAGAIAARLGRPVHPAGRIMRVE